MPDQPSTEERIAEALREHADWTSDYDPSVFKAKMKCYCGWSEYLEPGKSTATTFRAHVAAAVAGIVRDAQAEAVESAAESWRAHIRAMDWGTTAPNRLPEEDSRQLP